MIILDDFFASDCTDKYLFFLGIFFFLLFSINFQGGALHGGEVTTEGCRKGKAAVKE